MHGDAVSGEPARDTAAVEPQPDEVAIQPDDARKVSLWFHSSGTVSWNQSPCRTSCPWNSIRDAGRGEHQRGAERRALLRGDVRGIARGDIMPGKLTAGSRSPRESFDGTPASSCLLPASRTCCRRLPARWSGCARVSCAAARSVTPLKSSASISRWSGQGRAPPARRSSSVLILGGSRW